MSLGKLAARMSLAGALLAAGSLLGPPLTAATVPVGAELHIRLQSRVASNASKPQEPVEAVLIRPVVDDRGAILIPAGMVVKGVVKQAVAIKKPEDRALLELDFSSVTPPGGGAALKLECKLATVDNARETVEEGRISGILASETLASRIGSGVGKVAEKSSFLGDLLGAVQGAVLKEPEPEVVYEPGVEMTLQLTKPLTTSGGASTAAVPSIAPEDALSALVNNQPFQTTAVDGTPSDLTTIMFLGSQQQLEAAFAAAGWSTAAALSRATGLEVFRAVAENRGYKEAPMSVLLLAGQKPDLDFEKQNNTFAKRHHLRIWRRPGDFQGHPIWVCAATHDIDISFSAAKRTFIHKIDSQIDRERAKVVADLVFTGQVDGLALVSRPAAPQHSQNATGDNLETDGRMAVLLLK